MLKDKSAKEQIREWLLQAEPPTISEIIHRLSTERRKLSPTTARIYAYEVARDLTSEGHTLRVPKAKRGEIRHEDVKPLSDLHRRVGYRLNFYRDITAGLTPEQFCGVHNYFSPRILRQMELGAFDFTLTDLKRIGEVLDKSLSDLTAPIDTGVKCQTSSTQKSSFAM